MAERQKAELSRQPDELRERARNLVEGLHSRFHELGEILTEIKQNEMYIDWGYGSFREYVEVELSTSYRTAKDYVRVWSHYASLGFVPDDLRTVEWSKARAVLPLATNKAEARKWLKKTGDYGKKELESIAREVLGKDKNGTGKGRRSKRQKHDVQAEVEDSEALAAATAPTRDPEEAEKQDQEEQDREESGDPVVLHEFTVRLHPQQWAYVMAAIERAKLLSGSDKSNYLLELICQEFLSTYAEDADGGVVHRLEWHVKNLERIFGVEIDVRVPEGSSLRSMPLRPRHRST